MSSPSKRGAVTLAAAWLLLASVSAWQWWLAPQRAAAARAQAPELEQARTFAREQLRALGSEVALAHEGRVRLAWARPRACVERYELRVDEDFRDPSVAVFVGREPEHSLWSLSLSPRAGVADGLWAELARLDTDEQVRAREVWWSSRELGPTAPDFACRRRTWDPLEDALALGWPRLPAHPVHVGDVWIGAAVEGRCHETVCLDERGQFAHQLPCQARPWQEQLAGAGDGIAVLRSTWNDGHDPARPELGILTQRLALLQAGRPLLVRVEIDHRWSGVHRTLELRRLDTCPPDSA